MILKTAQINKIFSILEKENPKPETELKYVKRQCETYSPARIISFYGNKNEYIMKINHIEQ